MHMSSAWHILGRSEQETKQCRDEDYHIYFELALTSELSRFAFPDLIPRVRLSPHHHRKLF